LHCVYTVLCFPQGHVNISLIDYIGEKIVNNPDVLKECKVASFLSVVSGMANAEYKPIGWSCIQEALMTNTTLIRKVREAVYSNLWLLEVDYTIYLIITLFLECTYERWIK
jgi:hypothetical protein